MLKIFFLLTLTFSSICFAQEPARGRLTDGRAFRTDAEGVKLVDYIAELELSIEELDRKVYGLEDELDEKNALIESRGIKAPAPVQERDILAEKSGVSGVSDKGTLSYSDCLRVSCPVPAPCQVCPTPSAQIDSSEVESLRREVSDKSSYISTLEQRLKSAESSRNVNQETRAEVESLRASLRMKDQQISSTQEQGQSKAMEVNSLNSRVSSLTSQLSEKDSLIQSLRQEKESLQAQLSESKSVRTVSYSPRGAVASSRALGSAKATLRSELSRVRSTIASRNIKLKQYQRLPVKSVVIRNTEIRSARGLSLEAVGKRLAGTNSMSEISQIKQDLIQIKTKAQKDLSMITRLINSSKSKRG